MNNRGAKSNSKTDKIMQIDITDITDKKVAIALSKSVSAPKIILLSGNLGSGKSTFARFFINHKLQNNMPVQSPTFSLINVYKNIVTVIFID